MLSSQKVREAFAWAIDRESLAQDLLGGLGYVNYQPSITVNSPHYRDEWSWGTDFDKARQLMAEAGYADGFTVNFWVDGDFLTDAVHALARDWEEHLGVSVDIVPEYMLNRLRLANRDSQVVGMNTCVDGNFPLDWAVGFPVSSLSGGKFGSRQELPYATEVYSAMAGETDKKTREELAARFYSENRKWANCTGLLEAPILSAFNPYLITEWDMRPTANDNLGSINNVRSVKLD